jgi:hypothetical protein
MVPPDEGKVVGVHLLAGAEQFDVEIRDGRIGLPDLFLGHRRDYTSSRSGRDDRLKRLA